MNKRTIEELTDLAELAGDEGRTPKERIAAFRECEESRKASKVGWSKLGLDVDGVTALKAKIEALEGADTVEAKAEAAEDFEAPTDELEAQSGRPSVEDAKATAEAEAEAAQAKAAKRVKRAKDEGAGETRGGLTRLVESLLMDAKLSYLDIINAVIAEFPAANTSARSIASVAAGMRRKGLEVPMRRPVAQAKAAE